MCSGWNNLCKGFAIATLHSARIEGRCLKKKKRWVLDQLHVLYGIEQASILYIDIYVNGGV